MSQVARTRGVRRRAAPAARNAAAAPISRRMSWPVRGSPPVPGEVPSSTPDAGGPAAPPGTTPGAPGARNGSRACAIAGAAAARNRSEQRRSVATSRLTMLTVRRRRERRQGVLIGAPRIVLTLQMCYLRRFCISPRLRFRKWRPARDLRSHVARGRRHNKNEKRPRQMASSRLRRRAAKARSPKVVLRGSFRVAPTDFRGVLG
jgi:hypothetical protein